MSSSEKYPNLFVVLSRFPYPLEKGDKLRAYYQIKELSKHYSIYLFALDERKIQKEEINQLQSFCTAIHVVHQSKISIFFNLIYALVAGKPLQVGYFFNRKLKHIISAEIERIKPDHIYTQLVRTTEYTKNYHQCPKTLDYMDALSKGVERRIEKASFLTRWIFKTEFIRLKNYERSIFDYYEVKTIISEQDKNFIMHPDRKKIVTIPNGIDTSFFDFPINDNPSYDLVFVGNMSYAPNVDAIHYIAENILTKRSNLSLLVSGATPHPSILKLCKKYPQITLTGWVDDIRNSYANAKIFFAPMMIGTGMQNKLLEAMGMGLPCITTELANNAIGGKHNQDIIVCNTAEKMLQAIDKLLPSHELRQEIGQNGRKYVQENYSWESAIKKLSNHMNV